MTAATQTAHRCFKENLRLFAPAQAQPEKYNMYNGLANLAQAIGQIEARLNGLEAALNSLRAEMQRVRM